MSKPIPHNGHEHEFEPQFGLPEPLPKAERILWQGSPEWRVVALRVFHARKLAWYFALILAVRAGLLLAQGESVAATTIDLLRLLPLPIIAIGILTAMAWLSARTTVYTITDKRVVMRVGIVLTLTFNLPLPTLRNADLHRDRDGSGDIALQIPEGDHIAYLHLWPHVRPWNLRHPQPMLRCVPDSAWVAKILVTAWSAASGARAIGSAAAAQDAAPALPTSEPVSRDVDHGAANAQPAH